ncbi:MAG TPA: multicopper oxidase domain-containing protein [Acidobacteriaceae bacterium]|nr:multicopper oxidase domain-containing protein [Acidobacteriaceae bacterium]
MQSVATTRRNFLKLAGATAVSIPSFKLHAQQDGGHPDTSAPSANYTLHIQNGLIEIGKNRFVSTTTFNGQFPGPLLRFREGEQTTVAIHNDTDVPEQLHWHGQMIPVDVDGAAEEGTPFIPPHGVRTISFVPRPSGLRFYHTHIRAGDDLNRGQYTGQVGPVYIEAKQNPGRYDREVFLTLKEFEPWFSHGGDMANDFLAGAEVKELKDRGESEMAASLKSGQPHGFEVNYRTFTINGRMLGQGEPIRVKQGERVLFHVLNGSATEIRSLALPGHTFSVVAMDGNRIPKPVQVPVLWLGTAERISAVVEMDHPGVWILGDLADDDRHHGMGIVVEYAGQQGKPQWMAPKQVHWNYAHFGNSKGQAAQPDDTFVMTFAKQNAALHGFNRWTINGTAYPDTQMMSQPLFHITQGKRYRIRMRNASDDIHPIHLHRHSFELTRIAGQATSGVLKDVVMLGGYQEAEVDFVADNPGMTLFHCHQQLHMDFGFMCLFNYV